jgi:predicted GNAT family N-acyltransferase
MCHPVYRREDRKAAMAVRHEVFVEEQGIAEEEEYDGLDDDAVHYVVTDGEGKGAPTIATARIRFPDAVTAKVERMAVLKAHRHQGVGRRLLSFILDDLRTRELELVILHAQTQVRDFYAAAGFRTAGEPFQEAGLEHVEMRLELAETPSLGGN